MNIEEYCIEYLAVPVSFQFRNKIDFPHTKNKYSHTDCNIIPMHYNKIEKMKITKTYMIIHKSCEV